MNLEIRRAQFRLAAGLPTVRHAGVRPCVNPVNGGEARVPEIRVWPGANRLACARVNPETPGLHPHYTLICDDVRLELGNRFSLIGVFQNIVTAQLPISLVKLAAVTYWHGQGTGSAQVRVVSPDRTEVIVISEPRPLTFRPVGSPTTWSCSSTSCCRGRERTGCKRFSIPRSLVGSLSQSCSNGPSPSGDAVRFCPLHRQPDEFHRGRSRRLSSDARRWSSYFWASSPWVSQARDAMSPASMMATAFQRSAASISATAARKLSAAPECGEDTRRPVAIAFRSPEPPDAPQPAQYRQPAQVCRCPHPHQPSDTLVDRGDPLLPRAGPSRQANLEGRSRPRIPTCQRVAVSRSGN